jgi:hypothetical protein
MTAELRIIFKNSSNNLLKILQKNFKSNHTLSEIIQNTVYGSKSNFYQSYFVHGFSTIDVILLFTITGNELIVHVEVPNSNNLFNSLKTKIDTYYNNIVSNLTMDVNSFEIEKSEVIISSENSYIIIGKIPNPKKEFFKSLERDKVRLIITPLITLCLTFILKSFNLIQNIESIILGTISAFLGLFIWYLVDYWKMSKENGFKYELFI